MIKNANYMTDKDLQNFIEAPHAILQKDGTLPDEQIPGQVTDVLTYDKLSDFPATGDPKRYYQAKDTGKTYRWDVATEAYVESVVPTAAVTSVAGRTGAVTLLSSDVGLGSVVNTGDSATPVENGTTKFTTGGAYTELAKKADKAEMSIVAGTDADADKTTITLKSGTSTTVLTAHQDISGKADKVTGATNGHYATLDANGNLVDSGKGMDTTVTEDSGNLVTSGAVYSAVSAIDVSSQVKGKLDSTGQAPDFATETAYSVDYIVRHEGKLYRCKSAVAADNTAKPDADTDHWTALKLSTDMVTIVKLTNGSETMSSINARLATINTQGQHILFDVGAIVTTPQLYLCTIFIDTTSGALRLADQVTGKLYVGTYNGSETLSQVLAKAVDSYVSLTITAATLDGVLVTGQTVYLYEGDSATPAKLKQQLAYEGQPVTFTVPRGFEYFVTISSTLANHFSPSTAHGSANTATSVVLTYQDTSNITTFAGLQGFLAYVEADETLTSDAERIAFAEAALLPANGTPKEIADTWSSGSATYVNPMVVAAIKYFEEAPPEFDPTATYAIGDRVIYEGMPYTCSAAKSTASDTPPPDDVYTGTSGHWSVAATDAAALTKHLGVKMIRKRCTALTLPFDPAEGLDLVDTTTETTAQPNTGYYGWAAAYDSTKAYAVNSYCSYDGAAYKCTTAIAAGGETWDPTHWTLQETLVKGSTVYLSLSTGDALPVGSYLAIYKNGLKDSTKNIFSYGANYYGHSIWRQYLTSNAGEGLWCKKMHPGQTIPSAAASTRGYMAGCSEALLAAVKRAKITCAGSTIMGSRAYYDKFFLSSGTEMFGSVNGGEGTYDLLIKQRTGLDNPSNNVNSGRIFYAETTTGTAGQASYVWLRSPYTGNSCYEWYVYSNGNVGYNNGRDANYSCAGVPACVIW